MADEQDRHEESFGSDDTRYERDLEAERRKRHEAAERLKDDPLPEPTED